MTTANTTTSFDVRHITAESIMNPDRVSASELRDRARAKLSEHISRGQARAATVVERILTEVPRDRVLSAPALRFNVAPSGELAARIAEEPAQIHRHALDQTAQRAGMQLRFLHDLVDGATWARELAALNLNTLLEHADGRFLVREVGGQIRGVLSDSYRRIDSRPSVDALLGEADSAGAVVIDGIYTETRVSLKVVRAAPIEVFPGEFMVFGLDYANSDYGDGAHEIAAFLLRLVCLNGAVTSREVRRVHLGRRYTDSEWSERTQRLDAATQASATRDEVRRLLAPQAPVKLIEQIRKANANEVDADRIAGFLKTRTSKTEAETIVEKFRSADVIELPPGQTAWRLSNAVSWLAKMTDDGRRRMELERVAGEALG